MVTSRRRTAPPAADMHDQRGQVLAVFDRVVKACTDDGAPSWAHLGTVVGFGRTRVKVHWDGHHYGPTPARGAAKPHSPPPSALRKLAQIYATLGEDPELDGLAEWASRQPQPELD